MLKYLPRFDLKIRKKELPDMVIHQVHFPRPSYCRIQHKHAENKYADEE